MATQDKCTITGVRYSAPSKESAFSEILISAVKSTFSHSNASKNSFGEVFSISPYNYSH